MAVRNYGTNAITRTGVVTGETSYVLHAKSEEWDGTSRAVLACHNATGSAFFCDPTRITVNGVHPYLSYLAHNGFIIISSLFGGDLFGNDAQTTLMKEAADWAQANGAFNAPVSLFGWSAGAASICNFWRRFPEETHNVAMVTPLVNLTNGYADNPSLQAAMDAAFGGSYATNGTAFSPHNFAGSLEARDSLAWYASDDTMIRAADVTSFAAAAGSDLFDMAPGGHTALTNQTPDPAQLVEVLT